MFYYADLMNFLYLFAFTINPNTGNVSAYTMEEYRAKYGEFYCGQGGLKVEGSYECKDIIKLHIESATFTPVAKAKAESVIAATQNTLMPELKPYLDKGRFVLDPKYDDDYEWATFKPGETTCPKNTVVYPNACISISKFLNDGGRLITLTHVYSDGQKLTHMQFFD